MVTPPVLPAGAPFPRRICIVMLSALGDVVHALPIVTAIKRHAPATHVTWILQPGPSELVGAHPAVDEILIFERGKGLGAFGDLKRQLAPRPFDLVLDLQTYFKAGVITWLTTAPIKLGLDYARARDLNWLFTTHRIPPRPFGHIQDQFLEYLDAIGVPRGQPDWGLAPGADARARAQSIVKDAKRPLVGFVVATSKPAKNWPAERYAELAQRLGKEANATCVLLGGKSAPEVHAATTIEHAAHGVINALGCGLPATVALLKECDVVVSPDTGPYHMCMAMNVPAVGLYGYTNPKRFGPYGRFRDLMIDAYGDPGESYGADSGYREGRMERITVDAVLEKVKRALALQA